MRHLMLSPPCPRATGSVVAEFRRLAEETALIYEKLATANQTAEDQLIDEAGTAYLEALSVLEPDWTPPLGGSPLVPWSEKPGTLEALRQHECNAWHEVIRQSCWPRLFGHSDSRISVGTCISDAELRELVPRMTEDGLPAMTNRHTRLLYDWADGRFRQGLSEDAIMTAVLTKAGGGFDCLGDLILLAWRCEDDLGTRDALAWYLEHRVPTVGANGLPKLALRRMLSKKRSGR